MKGCTRFLLLVEKPPIEEDRIRALHRYEVLNTPTDKHFEDLTVLISQICEVPVAAITLVCPHSLRLLTEVGLGVGNAALEGSFCSYAILQNDLFIVPDVLVDDRFVDHPLVAGDPHIRFYAGALLKTSEGHALGTLCIADYVKRQLTHVQKEALQVLARQVMKLLDLRNVVREQARLLAEREQATSVVDEAYRHEKRIAETLQRSLLVDIGAMKLPGLNVVPLYEAASDDAAVGGDFYDAFSVSQDYVALVLGDVTGKGLEAASRTAEVKYALRAFLQEYPNPARTLERLNDFICEFHDYAAEPDPRFVVISLGLFNIRTGEATFSYAGAEPTIILRADGSSETIAMHGMPLGINKAEIYDTCVYNMAVDDTLLLATDGFTEARNDKTFLGIEGLRELAGSCKQIGSHKNWAEEILGKVKAYAGGSLRDDACLLLVQRL